MTEVIGVSALNRYVKSVLDGDGFLADLALRGEISGFVNHVKSGHWYFTLKDERASVKAVMFRQEARRLSTFRMSCKAAPVALVTTPMHRG